MIESAAVGSPTDLVLRDSSREFGTRVNPATVAWLLEFGAAVRRAESLSLGDVERVAPGRRWIFFGGRPSNRRLIVRELLSTGIPVPVPALPPAALPPVSALAPTAPEPAAAPGLAAGEPASAVGMGTATPVPERVPTLDETPAVAEPAVVAVPADVSVPAEAAQPAAAAEPAVRELRPVAEVAPEPLVPGDSVPGGEAARSEETGELPFDQPWAVESEPTAEDVLAEVVELPLHLSSLVPDEADEHGDELVTDTESVLLARISAYTSKPAVEE